LLKAIYSSANGRPVNSANNSTYPGSIQPRYNYYAKTIHAHMSTTVYSHVFQWTGAMWSERNYHGSKRHQRWEWTHECLDIRQSNVPSSALDAIKLRTLLRA